MNIQRISTGLVFVLFPLVTGAAAPKQATLRVVASTPQIS
jgi:hypothetical protein